MPYRLVHPGKSHIVWQAPTAATRRSAFHIKSESNRPALPVPLRRFFADPEAPDRSLFSVFPAFPKRSAPNRNPGKHKTDRALPPANIVLPQLLFLPAAEGTTPVSRKQSPPTKPQQLLPAQTCRPEPPISRHPLSAPPLRADFLLPIPASKSRPVQPTQSVHRPHWPRSLRAVLPA